MKVSLLITTAYAEDGQVTATLSSAVVPYDNVADADAAFIAMKRLWDEDAKVAGRYGMEAPARPSRVRQRIVEQMYPPFQVCAMRMNRATR